MSNLSLALLEGTLVGPDVQENAKAIHILVGIAGNVKVTRILFTTADAVTVIVNTDSDDENAKVTHILFTTADAVNTDYKY